MRFGGSKAPLRLRVARTILYCQAAIMALIAAFALEILVIGGAGTGLPLSGLVDHQTLTGNGTTVLALTLIVVAILLVVAEQPVTRRGGGARLVLVAAELAFAGYLIGWVSSAVGSWLFGPACGAAVLVLHYWPELHSYFFAASAATPAPGTVPPPAGAASPAGTEPPTSTDPPPRTWPPAGS